MIPAPMPPNELLRLATLLQHKVLDEPGDPEFEAITRVVAAATEAPVALISLIDAERQWFMCKVGLEVSGTPREVSFCGHAIMNPSPFIVPDATRDPRFADNPLVVGEPYVRAYLGMPLLAENGHALGTLCVISHHPRPWTPRDVAIVRDLAGVASHLIQSRKVRLDMSDLLASCAVRLAPAAA